MAQSNLKEEIINFTNVLTGGQTKSKQLYFQLKNSIDKAKRIDIIVSFLMESGVRLLLKDLKQAVDKKIPIRILTGNYLNITQPSALYLIKQELNNLRNEVSDLEDNKKSISKEIINLNKDKEDLLIII